MRSRLLLAALLVTLTATVAHAAAGKRPSHPATATRPAVEKATFAGGCFWSMESAFEGLPGVKAVISGYTGGPEQHPTYDLVSSRTTGHAESVEITFDPGRISYAQLLDVFWHNVDPTDGSGQFCDQGPEYRSEIFYHGAAQQRLAEASLRKLQSTPQRFKDSIITKIVAATTFWPAEEYHQEFAKKNPGRYHSYRVGCGRDERLIELWGQPGRQGEAQ